MDRRDAHAPLRASTSMAYRAYRVKSIDGDRVHLTVDVKAYAADATT